MLCNQSGLRGGLFGGGTRLCLVRTLYAEVTVSVDSESMGTKKPF